MKPGRWSIAVPLALLVAGAGCKNDNLFTGLHRQGTGDTASLVSDGVAALSRGDYAAAERYFEDALVQDPSNSDALYGAAAARMGNGGLDIGQLLSNLLTQGTPGGAPALTAGLAVAARGAPAQAPASGQSILTNIDINALDAALEVAICYLQRIQLGYTDGKIPTNDVNLLVNLGLCRLLRAATRPLKDGLVDIQKINSGQDFGYAVVAGTPFDSGQCAVLVNSFQDAAWGYQALNTASVQVLNQQPGDTLFDLKVDIRSLYTTYINDAAIVAANCNLAATLGATPEAVPAPASAGNCL